MSQTETIELRYHAHARCQCEVIGQCEHNHRYVRFYRDDINCLYTFDYDAYMLNTWHSADATDLVMFRETMSDGGPTPADMFMVECARIHMGDFSPAYSAQVTIDEGESYVTVRLGDFDRVTDAMASCEAILRATNTI